MKSRALSRNAFGKPLARLGVGPDAVHPMVVGRNELKACVPGEA